MAMKFICFVHQHQKHNGYVSLQLTKFKYLGLRFFSPTRGWSFSLFFLQIPQLLAKYNILMPCLSTH